MPEFSGASSFPFHSPLAPLPSNRTLSFTSTPRFPKLANEETLSPSPPLIFESLIPFLGRWNEGKRGGGRRTNGRRTERNGALPDNVENCRPIGRRETTTLLEYQSNSQFVQMRPATRVA